jgi:hypothetical protein
LPESNVQHEVCNLLICVHILYYFFAKIQLYFELRKKIKENLRLSEDNYALFGNSTYQNQYTDS